MKFLVQEPQKNQNFSLVYRPDDYSFDIEPLEGTGDASIMINDLQLEIDHRGQVMYVWGLCPLLHYKKTKEFPLSYKSGSLLALLDTPPILGISYRLNEGQRWLFYINNEMGWVCLGTPETKNKQLIEFAPNCIATMDGQELIAVWLHPEKLPDEKLQ